MPSPRLCMCMNPRALGALRIHEWYTWRCWPGDLATTGKTVMLHAIPKHTTCCTVSRREQAVPKGSVHPLQFSRTLLAHLGLDHGKLLLRHSWRSQHLRCQVHDLGHVLPESLEACAQAHNLCRFAAVAEWRLRAGLQGFRFRLNLGRKWLPHCCQALL